MATDNGKTGTGTDTNKKPAENSDAKTKLTYVGPDYKGAISLGGRRGEIDPKSWNADNIEEMRTRYPREVDRYFK